MYRFSNRKVKDKDARPAGDPFAAVPMLPDNVEMKRDSRGILHVRVHQGVTGLLKKVADAFGYSYARHVELDEYGTAYFSQIDGKKTLREIVTAMCDTLGGDPKESAQRVILFTKKLMTTNMIMLKVPQVANRMGKSAG